MIYAAIDIGSNTTRLLVGEPVEGQLKKVMEQRAYTRIGKAKGKDGLIPDDKTEEVAEVVETQVKLAEELGASAIRVVATAAIRDAPNGSDVAERISARAEAPVEIISEHADCLQVGARNIQNFQLLKEVGKTRKPVLLKRGMSTTIEEFLMSAEYVLSNGNHQVILCERGIRTFETATRNTLDLSAVPVLKEKTHLPVIVDPSHGTGHARYVMPMAYAAVAAGADGLMIEVHPRPEEALSDGPQSLRPNEFKHLMEGLRRIASAVDRDI